MQEVNKTPQQRKRNIPDVGELMLQLRRQRITQQGFRLPLGEEDAYELLYSALRVEVESKHRKFVADDETTRIVATLAKYLTSKDVHLTGLMFCGMCGNGKTTMLYALQNAVNWLKENNRFSKEQTERGLDRLNVVDARTIVRRMKLKPMELIKTPMLAIEDMGREPAEVLDYGNVTTPLTELLECRYDERLFTVITTNLTGKQIREKYGVRIADRINEMMEVVVFKNGSYR